MKSHHFNASQEEVIEKALSEVQKKEEKLSKETFKMLEKRKVLKSPYSRRVVEDFFFDKVNFALQQLKKHNMLDRESFAHFTQLVNNGVFIPFESTIEQSNDPTHNKHIEQIITTISQYREHMPAVTEALVFLKGYQPSLHRAGITIEDIIGKKEDSIGPKPEYAYKVAKAIEKHLQKGTLSKEIIDKTRKELIQKESSPLQVARRSIEMFGRKSIELLRTPPRTPRGSLNVEGKRGSVRESESPKGSSPGTSKK